MTTETDVVRRLCLSFPEVEEFVSHGFPTFRVRGRSFAIYSLNHHGDDRVALLLQLGKDMQAMLIEAAPVACFIPPYNGPAGWVGIELNKGFSWQRISSLVLDAYCRVAPASLWKGLASSEISPPTQKLSPAKINPLRSVANKKILKRLREFCLELPEVEENTQWGNPSFKAGKKSFCNIFHREEKTQLQFWVGLDRQNALVSFDERFCIPAYVGGRGWINLDVSRKLRWTEIEDLLLISYRHFALKRMLIALDG